MSDTPRTEAACWNLSFADVKKECLKLEQELNEAKAKIMQMEEPADHFKGRAEEFARKLAEYERQTKFDLEVSQWRWMVDWCYKKRLAPAQKWAWDLAEAAWEEYSKAPPTDSQRRSVIEKIRASDAENKNGMDKNI